VAPTPKRRGRLRARSGHADVQATPSRPSAPAPAPAERGSCPRPRPPTTRPADGSGRRRRRPTSKRVAGRNRSNRPQGCPGPLSALRPPTAGRVHKQRRCLGSHGYCYATDTALWLAWVPLPLQVSPFSARRLSIDRPRKARLLRMFCPPEGPTPFVRGASGPKIAGAWFAQGTPTRGATTNAADRS